MLRPCLSETIGFVHELSMVNEQISFLTKYLFHLAIVTLTLIATPSDFKVSIPYPLSEAKASFPHVQ